jgi:hypothetical protein
MVNVESLPMDLCVKSWQGRIANVALDNGDESTTKTTHVEREAMAACNAGAPSIRWCARNVVKWCSLERDEEVVWGVRIT